VPGPRAVTRVEYDFGDAYLSFSGFPTEFRAVVYYPTDLTAAPPFPIVMFLHGWHPTCYSGTEAFVEWPCTSLRQPIPSYKGYEYEEELLASHGYIVVSISANGVNARDTLFFDVGMQWRAALIQFHLDTWKDWNTTGAAPFGTTFVGKVDLTRVGTVGHSRGGEGVARHYNFNRELASPYGVRAVLPLAPVDFSRPTLDNTNLQVLLPYCDGDVSDLQGVHFYDDSRYFAGDLTNKHTTLVMGGNHAFYNTIWTPGGWPAATWDDWIAFEDPAGADPFCGTGTGNHRLLPDQVRGTLKAYATAFFRVYLGGETVFLPILKGDSAPPPSATTTEIFASYHAKAAAGSRLDVNRMLSDAELSSNTVGGAVTPTALDPYDVCGGDVGQCLPTQPTKRQPHTTPSARSDLPGLNQLRLGWNDATANYQNDIPAGSGNVSAYRALQFRASVNFADGRNTPAVAQDLSIALVDGLSRVALARVSAFSGALFYPPGQVAAVPKVVLNTVRVPLSAFTGIDQTDIRSIVFQFDQRAQGALLVSDIAFAD
jgi:hypothetical protein